MVLRLTDLGIINDIGVNHQDILELKILSIQSFFTESELNLIKLKQRIDCLTNNNFHQLFIGDNYIFYSKKDIPSKELNILLDFNEFSLKNNFPYRHSIDFSQPYLVYPDTL